MKPLKILPMHLGYSTGGKLLRLLQQHYGAQVVRLNRNSPPPDPDLLLFGISNRYFPLSTYLGEHWPAVSELPAHWVMQNWPAHCLHVAIIWENIRPNFKFFDYSFSFEETDDKNFQYPNFCNHLHFEKFRTGDYDAKMMGWRSQTKDRFCNFVHSDVKSWQRQAIVEKLMAYKRVDCAGAALNNTPPGSHLPKNKRDFISRYKFTIAFENRSAPNYITEKIYDALLVNSIPIYWGNPKAAEYFNPEAFINCHDYASFNQVVDRVIEVDNDDDLYRKYIHAPPVLKGSRVDAMSESATVRRLETLVDAIGVKRPVATTAAYKLRLPLYRHAFGLYQQALQTRAGSYLGRRWVGRHMRKSKG